MGRGDQTTHRPPPPPLYKHNSWSPDIIRDEEWLRRKNNHRRKNKSVTDEDIDELKACIELGFGFSESNDRLSNTLPALGLYYAVNKQYNETISKSPSVTSPESSSLFVRGDDPRIMKTRLRQWAQVVACSVRQSSSSPLSSSSSSPLSSL